MLHRQIAKTGLGKVIYRCTMRDIGGRVECLFVSFLASRSARRLSISSRLRNRKIPLPWFMPTGLQIHISPSEKAMHCHVSGTDTAHGTKKTPSENTVCHHTSRTETAHVTKNTHTQKHHLKTHVCYHDSCSDTAQRKHHLKTQCVITSVTLKQHASHTTTTTRTQCDNTTVALKQHTSLRKVV